VGSSWVFPFALYADFDRRSGVRRSSSSAILFSSVWSSVPRSFLWFCDGISIPHDVDSSGLGCFGNLYFRLCLGGKLFLADFQIGRCAIRCRGYEGCNDPPFPYGDGISFGLIVHDCLGNLNTEEWKFICISKKREASLRALYAKQGSLPSLFGVIVLARLLQNYTRIVSIATRKSNF